MKLTQIITSLGNYLNVKNHCIRHLIIFTPPYEVAIDHSIKNHKGSPLLNLKKPHLKIELFLKWAGFEILFFKVSIQLYSTKKGHIVGHWNDF